MLQYVADGLIQGSMIGLGAIGLTLVYSILRFANFTHGDLISWGAYLALTIVGVFALAAGAADHRFGPLSFGYDSLGITRFADSGFKNPEVLIDGFFVGDLDANGVDIPELKFFGGVSAAAELNLGVAKAGVAGGIFITVDFNFHDPNRCSSVCDAILSLKSSTFLSKYSRRLARSVNSFGL